MEDRLKNIAERIRFYTARDGDPEIAHGAADDLLVETIQVLSESVDADTANIVLEILAMYERVPKWYA